MLVYKAKTNWLKQTDSQCVEIVKWLKHMHFCSTVLYVHIYSAAGQQLNNSIFYHDELMMHS